MGVAVGSGVLVGVGSGWVVATALIGVGEGAPVGDAVGFGISFVVGSEVLASVQDSRAMRTPIAKAARQVLIGIILLCTVSLYATNSRTIISLSSG